MAGARKFNLSEITREEVWAANRETADVTGLQYITDHQDESAQAIMKK